MTNDHHYHLQAVRKEVVRIECELIFKISEKEIITKVAKLNNELFYCVFCLHLSYYCLFPIMPKLGFVTLILNQNNIGEKKTQLMFFT